MFYVSFLSETNVGVEKIEIDFRHLSNSSIFKKIMLEKSVHRYIKIIKKWIK